MQTRPSLRLLLVGTLCRARLRFWQLKRDLDRVFGAAVGVTGGSDLNLIACPVGSTLDYTEETFDSIMAVNAKGVFFGIKHAANAMLESGGGTIVNTASTAGLIGTPGIIAYGASKHAVVGMTKTAAREFAGQGIRCNAVCPSPIETRMWFALVEGYGGDDPETFDKERQAANPMGRYGKPEEVVALVLFLLSEDASYMNGAIVPVDGGSQAS